MVFSRRTSRERRIFFPWEARGGVSRYFAARRIAPPLLLFLLLALSVVLARRERRLSGERQTRATLASLRRGVSSYMARSKGKCPAQLEMVLPELQLKELPRDAWGRHFRLICPAQSAEEEFLIISDGADGLPGGRDRIEF